MSNSILRHMLVRLLRSEMWGHHIKTSVKTATNRPTFQGSDASESLILRKSLLASSGGIALPTIKLVLQ